MQVLEIGRLVMKFGLKVLGRLKEVSSIGYWRGDSQVQVLSLKGVKGVFF